MTLHLPKNIATPAYVLDAVRLKKNLNTAARIKRETGCKILLATKAFSLPAAFPLMRGTLDGTTASGEYEARMGREEFGKEVHVYSPAYAPGEVERLAVIADHVYFNSAEQVRRYAKTVRNAGKAVGLRINPGYSSATLGGALYDPCAPFSRFGATRDTLDDAPWADIHTLHVHALCEARHQGSAGLIEHVARNFAPYLAKVKAVNFGGGHFINKPDYNVDVLIDALKAFGQKFAVEIILEPGAGLVVDTGYLVATVLDLHRNDKNIAILDASASTHMPDVLEVPYTPEVAGAAAPGILGHDYILAGKTCMTGDIIGEYSFKAPLKAGDKVVFLDMMQYSFVKNNTFNGVPLPDLGLLDEKSNYTVLRSFGYDEFRHRLG